MIEIEATMKHKLKSMVERAAVVSNSKQQDVPQRHPIRPSSSVRRCRNA